MLRTAWQQLPPGVRAAVEAEVGTIVGATTAREGLNSEVAAFLELADGKTIFVKGLRHGQAKAVTQQREAMIAPYVSDISPNLLWQIDLDGWSLLGFDYIDGRHADYSPGSQDIGEVVRLIDALDEIPCPDLPLKTAEERWGSYVDSEAHRKLLRGDSLLHTDYNPLNVLVSSSKTYIIDWAWPTRGASWIDPACLVVRLLAAGNTPADAERWAAQTRPWKKAQPDSLDIFAVASARMWGEIAENDPVEWKVNMATSAGRWLDYRTPVNS